MSADDVPNDFPRDVTSAAVSGSSPKVCVRLVDGIYQSCLSVEERRERWTICEDLAHQFVSVAHKDAVAHPQHSLEQTVERVKAAVRAKRWLSSGELAWLGKRLHTLLSH